MKRRRIGDDGVALAHHAAERADLIELDISPVIEDEEAAAGLSKAYGSQT